MRPGTLIILLVVAAVVARDASKNRISVTGGPYSSFNGPIGWFIGSFALLIIFVPWYFFQRSKQLAGGGPRMVSSGYSQADELARFKQLLDSGAITLEEYEEKKRQILEL